MIDYQGEFKVTNGEAVCVVEQLKSVKQYFAFGKVGQQDLVETLYRTKDGSRVLDVGDNKFEIEGRCGHWIRIS